MNRVIRVSAWASKVVTLGVVAACLSCGGGDNSGANGAGGKSGSGSCSLAAGMYTLHYTVQSGSSADCPPIADVMEMVASSESFTNSVASMMTEADAGLECTTSDTGCSVSQTCSSSSAGVTIQLSITATVGTNSVSGQAMETIMDPAAGLSATCNYGITITPA